MRRALQSIYANACNRKLVASGLLVALLGASHVWAQTLTNNGQLITLTRGAEVTVQGGLLNKAQGSNPGIILNKGRLAVSGDWTNAGSYNDSTSSALILNGATPQTIRHNSQSIHQLQLDGEGQKTLTESATITQALILNAGILTPASDQVILLLTDQVSITGGSDASHVNGALYYQGTGDHTYPIGKSGHYRPVVLTAIAGINPTLGFEVVEPNPGAQPYEGVTWVSPVRYWQKNLRSGNFTDAIIALGFGEDEDATDPSALVVVDAIGPALPYRSLGQHSLINNAGERLITSQGRIAGNAFALGRISPRPDPDLLYLPNAFSPSSTNPEEKAWKIYGNNLSVEGLLLRIYNRWGEVVYETQSLEYLAQTGWDGRNVRTGKPEAQGVYTYTIKGRLAKGKLLDRVGTIQLMP